MTSSSHSPASATPYEVLGVPSTASTAELRRAYRALLRRTHPDAGGVAAEFHAVQAAWVLIGDEASRASYDRGAGAEASRLTQGYGTQGYGTQGYGTQGQGAAGTGVRARSFGTPGCADHARYVEWMTGWAETEAGNRLGVRLGRGLAEESFYDLAVIRAAPLQARLILARAQAAEATAALISSLGMGFTLWNDVSAGAHGLIDHVVLGPAGLFAIRSEDWGSEVRVVRDELIGEGMGDNEHPFQSIATDARALARELGLAFTALVIVVPDDALPGIAADSTRGATPAAIVVRRSVLPQLMREGLGGTERTSLTQVYEYRARLQQRIRHRTPD